MSLDLERVRARKARTESELGELGMTDRGWEYAVEGGGYDVCGEVEDIELGGG